MTITDSAELDRGDEDGDPDVSCRSRVGTSTFSVKVENTSAVDSVTITSLNDDVYGNLDGEGTCDVPLTLAPGASYNCSFSGSVCRRRWLTRIERRHCLRHGR